MSARGEEPSWDVVYYRQADGQAPALDFLDGCPIKLQARFDAVLDDVAAAPPPRYSGGGRWEAMHGDMGGFYEVRLGGPNREQFRLFCILDNGSAQQLRDRGLTRPAIAVITGMRKPFMTVFDEHDYAGVRRLGDEYRGRMDDNADIFKCILDEPAFQAVVMDHYLQRVFAQARLST